jgi:predicted  nucleic acid-binding Zn-ribbon protein
MIVEDVAEKRARLESDLSDLRRQFIDKARVIERMRVDVRRLESLAALSRYQRSELERLTQHIEEHSETLRKIREATDERRAEYAELERTTSVRRRSVA